MRVGAVIPSVGVAVDRAELGGVFLPDGEVQCDNTVATVDGMEVLGVFTGASIGAVVPNVEVASGVGPEGGGVMPDGEVQGDNTVTTVCCMEQLFIVN